MDTGTLITVIIVGLFLLFLLFLPTLIGSSTQSRPDNQRDAEGEATYRRGLMIGSLMEEARETQHTDPQHLIEQVIIDQAIIEHIQHYNDRNAAGGEQQHHQ
ncbi:hypothetical protein [Ktedonobacter racemifer]|uniref:Uncharacterized protein n=1 Tax=Ktedonobacter racemifer DSM 44963 TaxID=485913 RepID=D6U718_KTERA|nr:hypothetical protein [Ktedonobacter racemifer]EFH79679.1 hypothetical protein Krac_0165 [Ktedonobacter racemifer DSM 44963]